MSQDRSIRNVSVVFHAIAHIGICELTYVGLAIVAADVGLFHRIAWDWPVAAGADFAFTDICKADNRTVSLDVRAELQSAGEYEWHRIETIFSLT